MEIIVCGFSRTGSSSLLSALEILGFHVYHGKHVFQFDHQKMWVDAMRDPEIHMKPIMDELLRLGYNSTSAGVLGVACLEMKELYPDAKVLLTVRDNEIQWAASFQKFWAGISIYVHPGGFPYTIFFDDLYPIFIEDMKRMNVKYEITYEESIFPWVPRFSKDIHLDEEDLKKAYLEFNEKVIKEVREDQLLMYNIKQGWEPLVKFLRPDLELEDVGEFPNVNKRGVWKLVRNFLLVLKWYPFIIAFVVLNLFYTCWKLKQLVGYVL